MGHPQANPEWATNATYSSPGDPWDGDPTKVEPPAGKTAEGWEPTEEPPAEFLNDWQNKVGQILDYLRLIQPTNWELVRDISPTTPQRFKGIGYDGSTGVLVVTGDTAASATFFSQDGGRFWVSPTTPPIAFVGRAVASDGAGNWVVTGDSASVSESSDDGDNWATQGMGGASDQGNDVEYDAANGLWIVTGENVGGGAGRRLWTSPDRATWTNRISDASGNFIGDIWVNAAGFSVALSNAGVFYTSPDGVTWTARSVAGATSLQGVTYSESAGLWMITGSDGARAVFTSTDGITFTKPAGQVIDNKSLSNINCDQGELFVVSGGSTTADEEVYVSTDRGLTWTQVAGWDVGPRGPASGQPTPTGFGSIAQDLEYFAGRFMLVNDAGDFWYTPALL